MAAKRYIKVIDGEPTGGTYSENAFMLHVPRSERHSYEEFRYEPGRSDFNSIVSAGYDHDTHVLDRSFRQVTDSDGTTFWTYSYELRALSAQEVARNRSYLSEPLIELLNRTACLRIAKAYGEDEHTEEIFDRLRHIEEVMDHLLAVTDHIAPFVPAENRPELEDHVTGRHGKLNTSHADRDTLRARHKALFTKISETATFDELRSLNVLDPSHWELTDD